MSNPAAPNADDTSGGTGEGAIARQAIVDDKGNVFGFALLDRSHRVSDHGVARDASLLLNALTHADTGALFGKYTMFVNCALESLGSAHLEMVKPDRIVLELPHVPDHDEAAIERHLPALTELHERGFRLAFNQMALTVAYRKWLPLASYIKLDLTALKPEQVEPAIRMAQRKPQFQVIVEKVETAEQHKMVANLGVTRFQGNWFAKPVLMAGQTVRPGHANIIQLINLVRRKADIGQIEEVLKRDASLSFNLLRFINSSGFGLSTEITSFRHAVMILGLDKLFRWSAMLLTTSREGGTPPVVGNTAIVRGRLMELLAEEMLPKEECDNAFVTGVFSLLDAMLGVPIDKALDAITLPDSVTDALLHKTGPLAPLLELTIACEQADDEAFARIANALTLSNHQVNWAHLQALAWAETLGR
ncbi:MAG: HDOD domain-containing protein [Burkholderiaceae bacterium]